MYIHIYVLIYVKVRTYKANDMTVERRKKKLLSRSRMNYACLLKCFFSRSFLSHRADVSQLCRRKKERPFGKRFLFVWFSLEKFLFLFFSISFFLSPLFYLFHFFIHIFLIFFFLPSFIISIALLALFFLVVSK